MGRNPRGQVPEMVSTTQPPLQTPELCTAEELEQRPDRTEMWRINLIVVALDSALQGNGA